VWRVLVGNADRDHNRSVVTFAAAGRGVERRGASSGKAAELIDLREAPGRVIRESAPADVIPFVPLTESSMADCVAPRTKRTRDLARYGVPVYFYEAGLASGARRYRTCAGRNSTERRRNVAHSRHPTAGASMVGARGFLVGVNVSSQAANGALARKIAPQDSRSLGGFKGVRSDWSVSDSSGPPAGVDESGAFEHGRAARRVLPGDRRRAGHRSLRIDRVGHRAASMKPRRVFFRRAENFNESRVLDNCCGKSGSDIV